MAMRHRALSAWRSPPRLSLWRTVRPEEASIGLAPQSAAKDASLRRRSGLSPAATSGGDFGADARRGQQSGSGLGAQTRDIGVELADLGAESPPAAREHAYRGS